VLVLFRAPGSDPRPTVEVISQRGRGAPVKVPNPSAGTIRLSSPPADLRRAASPDWSAGRCGALPLSPTLEVIPRGTGKPGNALIFGEWDLPEPYIASSLSGGHQ